MSAPTHTFCGEVVHPIGFGAMALCSFYGQTIGDEESHKVVLEAFKQAGPVKLHIDTGLKDPKIRSKVFLATKFGLCIGEDKRFHILGGAAYVKQAVEKSLKLLQTDHIDLYYHHRSATNATVEETIGAMKELQEAGKIKHIGISEYSADEIRRAAKVAKIAALQIELSPWTPNIVSNGILDLCKELGSSLVNSPLGRGMLVGRFKKFEDLDENDWRRGNPRFSKENFPKNLELANDIKKIAEKKGITASQVTLAWVLAQDPSVVAIPGTKKVPNVIENMDAAKVELTPGDLKEIDGVIASFKVSGERYDAYSQTSVSF